MQQQTPYAPVQQQPNGGQPMIGSPQQPQVVYVTPIGPYPPGTSMCCGRPLFHGLGLFFGFSVLSNVGFAMGGHVILVTVLTISTYCNLFGYCAMVGGGKSATSTSTLSDTLSRNNCTDTSIGMRVCTVIALLTALACFGSQCARVCLNIKSHPLLSKVAMVSALVTAFMCAIAGVMEALAANCISGKVPQSTALVTVSVTTPAGVALLVSTFVSLFVAWVCFKAMHLDTAASNGGYQPMGTDVVMMQQQPMYAQQPQQQQQLYAQPPPQQVYAPPPQNNTVQ